MKETDFDVAIDLLQQHRDQYLKSVKNLESQLIGVQKAIDAYKAKLEAVESAIESIHGRLSPSPTETEEKR